MNPAFTWPLRAQKIRVHSFRIEFGAVRAISPTPPYLEPLQPGHGPEGAEAAEGSEDLHGGHPLEPHVGQHLVGNGKLEWYQIK